MDAVLGLSVTPSAVGLVLVEGPDADGATVDHDAFENRGGRRSTPAQTSDEAVAAVLRTEAIAATRGHRLQSIGVTWSEDAGAEASLVLKSLQECGFDRVVPVQLPEASEALAWGIAEVIGHDVTAVCVIESETAIALIVDSRGGAVQTAVNDAIQSEEGLIRWLSAVFGRANWRPEALVMVGSGGGIEALMPQLEDVLCVPVFAPAETGLALARGAALASAHSVEVAVSGDAGRSGTETSRHRQRRPTGQAGPMAMLVAGTVTFVVSVSVAVSLQFAPKDDAPPAEPRTAAKSSPEPNAVSPSPPAAPPPAAPVTDAWSATVAEAPPPPVEPPAAPPAAPVDVPVAAEAAPPMGGPPPEAVLAPAPPQAPIAAAPPGAALPPAPGLVPAEPTPLPEQRPGILRRIKDRLSNIGGNDDVQGGQPAPAMAPPPGDPPPVAPAVAPPPPEAAPLPPPDAATGPPPEAPPPPAPLPPPAPPAPPPPLPPPP